MTHTSGMTKDEAREAKREMLAVVGTGVARDDEHHGTIVQVGFHESGNESLVAVEGHYGTRWFHHAAVRIG